MNEVSVAIRRAVPEDCTGLLGLIAEHALFEGCEATLTGSDLLAILQSGRPPVILFVASAVDELFGFAALTVDFSLWRGRRWAHLDCLFVREDSRGGKLGEKLIRAATDHARRIGADRMEWQTPVWNGRAVAFYRRIGADDTMKVRFAMALLDDATGI
jgi:GNAT superfamily N-acetyltransferase